MRKSLSEMSLEELWMLFPIILEEHNPMWEKWYLEEKKLIMSIIEIYNIERINHIGSTSVNRLIAKPTIDILLEITGDCDLKFLVNVLEENGYIFEKQLQKPAPHMMFMKGYTEKGFAEKVFHLHVRYLGDWMNYILEIIYDHIQIFLKPMEILKLTLKINMNIIEMVIRKQKRNLLENILLLQK